MELILTEQEKKTASWLDLDDESLGKFVKANICKVKELKSDIGIFLMSLATAFCAIAHETNADTFSIEVNGLKNKTNDLGNWKVTAKRLSK
jgi:hypothetical protein